MGTSLPPIRKKYSTAPAAARSGMVDGVLGVVLAAVEAENLIEDRLDDLLARIGFATDPFSFQVRAGSPKLARVQRRAGIGKTAGDGVDVLAAKEGI